MKVSILIAARNEEANIILCLQSVNALSYAPEDFEVLIGNDASEDRTGILIEDYIQDKPTFRLFNIQENIGLARGKANVLAQLAHHAKGGCLLMTDADIQVPPLWIQAMLGACSHNTGVVAGITIVKGQHLFHHLQSLDWAYAFGMVHLLMIRKIPVTAMGNNMLITKEAYQAVGGYENIPFSVTEDFTLFHAIVNKGYHFTHLLTKDVLAYSQPVLSFTDLLNQRKRWMGGAVKLPFYIKCIFLIQALIFPLLIIFLWIAPKVFLIIFFTKILFDIIYLLWVLNRIKELHLIRYVLLYEIYMAAFSMLTLLYYFVPGKLQWKGRKYETK